MYWFFASYKREPGIGVSPELQTFLDDLERELRPPALAGASDQPLYFIDRDIELGEAWDRGLARRLNESSALICMLADGYTDSEYCQKELEFFQRRIPHSTLRPRVILPVIWNRANWRLDQLPKALRNIQYVSTDLPDQYLDYGLKALANFENGQDDYKKVVRAIADWVGNAASQSLPRYEWDGPLGAIVLDDDSPEDFDVFAVAVAPRRWRPFMPGNSRVLTKWVARIAVERDYLIHQWVLSPDTDLLGVVDRAHRERGAVLCLLNPYTVGEDDYRAWIRQLAALDPDLAHLVALVVVWTEDHDDPSPAMTAAKTSLFDVLAPWALRMGFVRYLDELTSPAAVTREIPEVLAKLRSGANFKRPNGTGPPGPDAPQGPSRVDVPADNATPRTPRPRRTFPRSSRQRSGLAAKSPASISAHRVRW